MSRKLGSVLLTATVIVLAIFGNKNSAPMGASGARPVSPTPTVTDAPKPKWGAFVGVMAICLAVGVLFVLGTGEMRLPAQTPLPAPLVPPPLDLRIIFAVLVLAPVTLGLGVVLWPVASPSSAVRKVVAKDEIIAPWVGVLLFVGIAGAWLDGFLSQELALLVFVLPWVGGAKTLLRTAP